MPKKRSKGWRVVTLIPGKTGMPAVKTVSEREEGGICPGCMKEKKTLRSYTGVDGEPITCSMNCRARVLEARMGGVRTPTTHQLRVTKAEADERARARTAGLITGLEPDPSELDTPFLHLVQKTG